MQINSGSVKTTAVWMLIAFIAGFMLSTCVTTRKVIAAEIDPGKMTNLQFRAAKLYPGIEDEYLKMLQSKGNIPNTGPEKAIFKCLEPSVKYEQKTKGMTDEQYRDQGGALIVEMNQMFAGEKTCLEKVKKDTPPAPVLRSVIVK